MTTRTFYRKTFGTEVFISLLLVSVDAMVWIHPEHTRHVSVLDASRIFLTLCPLAPQPFCRGLINPRKLMTNTATPLLSCRLYERICVQLQHLFPEQQRKPIRHHQRPPHFNMQTLREQLRGNEIAWAQGVPIFRNANFIDRQ